MQKSKSLYIKPSANSEGWSALDSGMARICDKVDQENAASVKALTHKNRLPKVVRRRLIPLKGENPAAEPLSSHFPWIKKHARAMSKP